MKMGRPLLPCDDPRVARRRMQYRNARARRQGRPVETVPLLVAARTVVPAPRPVRAVASLATHVDRSAGPKGCWLWLGNRDENGYGRLRVDGHTKRAHRHALEKALGRTLRSGYGALHHCDTPPCVNPAHLYEGTPKDNTRDAIERGRWSPMSPAVSKVAAPLIVALGVAESAVALGVSKRTIYRTLQRARAAA